MSLDLLYNQLHSWFPVALWQGDPERHEIALTFDDGPDPNTTPELLAVLDRLAIKATFFQVGERAERSPQIVREVAAAGHQIGLHGYKHQSFLLKGGKRLIRDLAKTQSILAEASGVGLDVLHAVRPPYGHFTPSTLKTLIAGGYLPTMWSVVPFHWRQNLDATVRQVHNGVCNGAILVLHEGLPGPDTADLAQAVLPHLIAKGYRFVTVNTMWASLQRKVE